MSLGNISLGMSGGLWGVYGLGVPIVPDMPSISLHSIMVSLPDLVARAIRNHPKGSNNRVPESKSRHSQPLLWGRT